MTPEAKTLDDLRFNSDGLVPAIVQDAETGEVLMMAWMNRAALERTIATRKATYWSRSRQQFWVKGETSGNLQHVESLHTDCDQDVVLVRVRQEGAACHEGYRSCFFREWTADGHFEPRGEPLMDPRDLCGPSP